MVDVSLQALGESYFSGQAHKGFERARNEVLAARVPHIAFLANLNQLSENQVGPECLALYQAYTKSAEAGCHEPVLFLCQTEVDQSCSDRWIDCHTDIAGSASELHRVLFKHKIISDPLDLEAAAESVVVYNEIGPESGCCDAAVFLVVGHPEVTDRAVDGFGKIRRQGTPTFILHAISSEAPVGDDVQKTLFSCASVGNGLYVPYCAERSDILSDHLGSIVTFATGIPSIVSGRVGQVSTPEGKMFAAKLAASFANLTF